MNCVEWEKLSDAYLDGQLSGSLRLEFDSHRLRCVRCQRTLAVLESCAHVIASDDRVPAMSSDFTDRLMSRIARRPKPRSRIFSRRILLTFAAVTQAAAVLALVAFAWRGGAPPAGPVDITQLEPSAINLATVDFLDMQEYVYARMDRVAAARSNLTSDVGHLAAYAMNLSVSPELLRASADLSASSPTFGFLEALSPPAAEPPAESPADSTIFSL